MTYTIRRISEQDSHALIDIFNYYIENSFAPFPEKKVPCEFIMCIESPLFQQLILCD
jgi:L-amino acid N-acyltransferase YncA